MSYNAALSAINLGYSNVLWYRGGIEAWQAAGMQLVPAQGGYPQPGGGPAYSQPYQQQSYAQQPYPGQQPGYGQPYPQQPYPQTC